MKCSPQQFAIDTPGKFWKAALMSPALRKYIAVLLALWLPLFSGGVLAESLSMQLQRGSCHEAAQSTDEHIHHPLASAAVDDQSADQQGTSCNACGVCHLACSGYLAGSDLSGPAVQRAAISVTSYLLSFHSITSIPLLPPPLTRV
jgi:ferredoxin